MNRGEEQAEICGVRAEGQAVRQAGDTELQVAPGAAQGAEDGGQSHGGDPSA